IFPAIERCGLARSALVVAVSGGPDSVALLLALLELRDALDLRLYVAHFDHQLRPDSAADAAFIRGITDQYQLPLTVGRDDVARPDHRAHRGSEAAWRRARYAFLSAVARNTASAA